MRIAVKFQIRCKAFQQQKDLRPSAIFRHREEQELCLFQALHGLHTEFFDASVPVCVRAAVSRIQNGQICRLAPQRVTGVERAVLCIVARKENALSVPFKSQPDAACAVPGTPPCDLQAGQFRHRAGAFARAETFQRLDTNDDGILEKDGTSLAIHFNYSQSLASIDNAVLSIAASLKELGFDVTIDAVDMNTWYGALMAGEYDLTFYNTAGGSFDPATDMSNMAPGAMGDPILCQFSAFFENPEIFAELDSTSDSQRVQEIYGMILNGIADQNLLVPVTGTHDLALWNTDKITGYDFYTDASYVDIASVHVK